jgi:hypothetical protein
LSDKKNGIKKNGISLCTVVDNDLAKEFHSEVVNQHGLSYGNTGKCLKEAIELWVKESKKKRLQQEKLTKK